MQDQSSTDPSRILIIDDDEDVRQLVTSILQREGFICAAADSGEAGLELAAASAPDLILLDLQMPNGDGVDFLRNRLLSGPLLDTPVIMLTNSRRPEEISRLVTLNISQYVLKPIEPKVLVDCVRRHLDKS